jgi:hypothetical protein
MADKITAIEPGKGPARVLMKALLFGSAIVALVLLSAHFVWKYSGSNEWELVSEASGARVLSLKVPGNSLKQFKVVGRVKATLKSATASLLDNTVENGRIMSVPFYDPISVEPWSSQTMTSVYSYKIAAPLPFADRDAVLTEHITQDPQNKSVLVDILATPNKLPKEKCCYRIVDMHNTWRFTPLEDGYIEVEIVTNMDPGVPYVFFNARSASSIAFVFSRLPKLFNLEKHRNEKMDFILE